MLGTKIIKYTCLSLAAAVLSACSASDNTALTAESVNNMNEIRNFQATTEFIKPLGRTYYEDGLLWCAYSGTGAEFSFSGKKCEITLKGDITSSGSSNKDNQARVAVYLNGERVVDTMMDEEEKTVTVLDTDKDTEAVVSIVKLSETAMSCFAVKNIAVDGTAITPTPDKNLFIEFVGDSITCGYGVDDEDENHHFVTATEDVTKAYAYQTAANLNADYSMVSISGYGIISGYTDSGKKIKNQTIPQYYTKLGFSYGSFAEDKPHNYKWDFSGREPDAVVINLGTNDDSYCKDDQEKQNEYKEGYIEFLKKIRSNNPNAKIVCILGLMGDRLYPVVEKAVSEYSEETGDLNITNVHINPQLPSDGYAADWHPTFTSHTKAAATLTEQLKLILGLN